MKVWERGSVLSLHSDVMPEHCSNYKPCSGTANPPMPCLILYILLSIKNTFIQLSTQKKITIQTSTNVFNSSTLSLVRSSSFCRASKACVLCLAKPCSCWDVAVSCSVIAHSFSILLSSLASLRSWNTSTETQQSCGRSWWGGMVDYKQSNEQTNLPHHSWYHRLFNFQHIVCNFMAKSNFILSHYAHVLVSKFQKCDWITSEKQITIFSLSVLEV